MKYFVSRQSYWGVDEPDVVEIAGGGLDYAGADMLVCRWLELGEGGTFDDPREAVEAAIKIRDAWKLDGVDARIEYGYTAGMTMPFEEYPTDEDARAWAEERWESLPKCDRCGERYTGPGWMIYENALGLEDVFCSEFCADEAYAEFWLDQEDEDEEDNEPGPYDPWGGWW